MEGLWEKYEIGACEWLLLRGSIVGWECGMGGWDGTVGWECGVEV